MEHLLGLVGVHDVPDEGVEGQADHQDGEADQHGGTKEVPDEVNRETDLQGRWRG